MSGGRRVKGVDKGVLGVPRKGQKRLQSKSVTLVRKETDGLRVSRGFREFF